MSELPDPPKNLSRPAKDLWIAINKRLAEQGLRTTDLEGLAAICIKMAENINSEICNNFLHGTSTIEPKGLMPVIKPTS